MTEIIPFKKAALLQEKETTAAEIISKSRWAYYRSLDSVFDRSFSFLRRLLPYL